MGKFSINPGSVESNIVLFDTVGLPVSEVLEKLQNMGVGMVQFGSKSIRATFHFQVGDEDLGKVIEALKKV
jgi:threonine aldolase